MLVLGRPGGGLGEEFERVGVAGAYDAEVAVVKGADLDGSQAFGDGHQACVGAAQREVGVGVDELGHPGPVAGGECFDGDGAGGDAAVERCFGGRADLTVDQPAGLGDDQGGGDQRPGVLFDEVPAGSVVGVVAVSGGEEDAGIDEEHPSVSPETLSEHLLGVCSPAPRR